MSGDAAPEFSRPVDLDRIGDSEVVHNIVATAEERAALVRRFELLALGRLEARITLRRNRGGIALRLAGTLTADLVQACVVTLAPVPDHVEVGFTVLYGDEAEGQEIVLNPEADEAVEPLPAGLLDIGETAAQELALALNPYPRAPGAALDAAWEGGKEKKAEVKNRPFASLSKLQKGKS